MERDALDARNSPNRPKTWLEKIADKYNSEDYCPQSEVFPNLHDDFMQPVDLSLDHCPGVVKLTEQVKASIADRKAKLVLLMDRWELSGNGDGQRIEQEDAVGESSIDIQSDNRSSFLKIDRSSLLYCWQMLEKYEILEQMVSILPRELGVSTMGNVSSVSEDSAMKKRDGSVAAGSSSSKKKRKVIAEAESFKRLHETLCLIARGLTTGSF
jgi:hypothetical protein